ncbi:hypothetical protein [Propioniciclava sp.]|uniref:hypothetical protein n=1 Tax=Propioniciclava sp. TaxID=2038686 RepID=UPI002604BA47|nr:hypothetical protein [Propioniciclava sp.]
MARRVLTAETIDDLLAQGQTEVPLGPTDIVTALAREHARDRGVRLVPADEVTPAASSPGPETPGSDATDDAALVRRAVIGVLGREPDGLDAVIARVIRQEQG